jgi:hypothetical protein
MMKFKLSSESNYIHKHIITHEFEAETLMEVLESMEAFLRGVGYVFDGQLTIVDRDDTLNFDDLDPAPWDEPEVLANQFLQENKP